MPKNDIYYYTYCCVCGNSSHITTWVCSKIIFITYATINNYGHKFLSLIMWLVLLPQLLLSQWENIIKYFILIDLWNVNQCINVIKSCWQSSDLFINIAYEPCLG